MQLSYEIETKIRDIIREVTEPAIIKVSQCLQIVNKLKIRFQQIDLKLDESNQQISQLNLGLQMKFSELDSGIQKILRIESVQAEKDVQFNQDQFEFKLQIDKIMNELKGYEESIKNQQSKFNHYDGQFEIMHSKMDNIKLSINAQIWKGANDQHQFQVTERNYVDEIKENVAMLLQANTVSRQETKEIQKKLESYNLIKNKLLKIDESKLQMDHKLDIKDFMDFQEQMNLQLEETKTQITSQMHEFSQEQQDTQQCKMNYINYSIELYVSVETKIKDNRVELKKEIEVNKLRANDQYGNSILQLQKSFKEIKASLEVDQNSRLNAKGTPPTIKHHNYNIDVQRMIQTLKDEMDDLFFETNRELKNFIRQQESQIQDLKNKEIEEIHQHQQEQIKEHQIQQEQIQPQPQQIDAAQLVSLKQDILQHTEYAIKKALTNYENQHKEMEALNKNKKSLSIESIEIPKIQIKSQSIQNLQIVQNDINQEQFSDYDRRLDDMTIILESNDVKLQLIQEYLKGVSQMIQGKAIDINKERMNYFLEDDEQSMEQFLSVKNRIYQLELFCRSKTNEYDNQYIKFTNDKNELVKQFKDFESMVLNTYVRRVEEQMMLYEKANNQISKIKSDHSNENDYTLKQMDILQKKNQKIILSEQNIMNYMVQMQNTIKLLYSVALQNEYVANKHSLTQSFSSINDGFLFIYAPKCIDEKLFFTYKSQRVNKSEALALQLKEMLSEPMNEDLEQKRGTVNLPRLGETKYEKVSRGKNPNESGQNFKKVTRRDFSTDAQKTNIMDFFSDVKSPEILRNKKPSLF